MPLAYTCSGWRAPAGGHQSRSSPRWQTLYAHTRESTRASGAAYAAPDSKCHRSRRSRSSRDDNFAQNLVCHCHQHVRQLLFRLDHGVEAGRWHSAPETRVLRGSRRQERSGGLGGYARRSLSL
eukprot:scaffold73939_cov26-Tisochrysis_lutea.AAC.2